MENNSPFNMLHNAAEEAVPRSPTREVGVFIPLKGVNAKKFRKRMSKSIA